MQIGYESTKVAVATGMDICTGKWHVTYTKLTELKHGASFATEIAVFYQKQIAMIEGESLVKWVGQDT